MTLSRLSGSRDLLNDSRDLEFRFASSKSDFGLKTN